MKNKLLSVILIISFILFTACTTKESTYDGESSATSELISDAISETDDLFEKLRNTEELWIEYGLKAYENDKTPQNPKSFFSETGNLIYLSLYDDMFIFDNEKSVAVAEAFFKFVYENYGVDAILDVDKRIEYKTEFLKSIGSDIAYNNGAETLLAKMDCTSDDEFKYNITIDNVTYHFNNLGSNSISQYHAFIYYNYNGLNDLIEFIKTKDLTEFFDINRHFNYYLLFDSYSEDVSSYTIYETGDMYVYSYDTALHETVHSMGIGNGSKDIWLYEGLCEYFGKSLGLDKQVVSGYIQVMTMAKQGYFDERALNGDKSAMINKYIYENYTAKGGKLDSLENFDLRLYADISAKAEFEIGGYQTLEEVFEIVNKKECDLIGKELSYNQSASLVLWLVDLYGIEGVMEAYKNGNANDVFGKSYEELINLWSDYLNVI